MPVDVKGREPGKEVQRAVRQVIVDPPGHVRPVAAARHVINKPRQHYASGGTALAPRIRIVPDVTSMVGRIGRAIQIVRIAEFIDSRRAVARSDVNPAKGGLQGFK